MVKDQPRPASSCRAGQGCVQAPAGRPREGKGDYEGLSWMGGASRHVMAICDGRLRWPFAVLVADYLTFDAGRQAYLQLCEIYTKHHRCSLDMHQAFWRCTDVLAFALTTMCVGLLCVVLLCAGLLVKHSNTIKVASTYNIEGRQTFMEICTCNLLPACLYDIFPA